MNILFLTQILPYPPDAGPRIKTWYVLRYLVERGHAVTLLTFLRPDESRHVEVLEKLCHRVITVPIRRSRKADMGYLLRSFLTGRPFLIERDDLEAMRHAVAQALSAGNVDVIHADQLTMTQFALAALKAAPGGSRPRLIFDAHNATWTILDRMAQTVPWPLRPALWLERERVKKYEAMLVECYDHTLAVTEVDRQALLKAVQDADLAPVVGDKIRVIPIAVDAGNTPPVARTPGSLNILTLGTLHYPPNANGIRWFINEVFPLVRQSTPGATLTVVGKNPPADFQQAAQASGGAIAVTGYVPDLRPYFENAALMVVPVLAGGGMRVRILEAFAHGMPVVTTTIGLEGIDAQPGRDVLVEDTPAGFAAAVSRLLAQPEAQAALARNGRDLVCRKYDWRVVLQQLDAVYRNP